MFWTVLLASVVLIGLVFILMSIKILIKKNGKFPNTHIGANKEMTKRGIVCATTFDKMEQKQSFKIKNLHIEGDHEANTTSC